MPVSPAEREYLLSQIGRFAQTDLNNLWRQADQLGTEDFFQYVRDGFVEVATTYHQTTGQLAATWFEESDPLSPYIARVAEPITRERLLKSAEWALGGDGVQGLSRMQGSMQRAVYDGARETVITNSEATRSRWVRVTRANACEFCRMLATRSGDYAYLSRKSALSVTGSRARNRREGAQKMGSPFHDDCYCTAVEVRDGQSMEDVLDEEKLKLYQQWTDEYEKAVANAGSTDTKKVMAAWRKQNAPIVQVSQTANTSAVQVNDPLAQLLPRKTVTVGRSGALADADASNPGWTPTTDLQGNPRYRDNCTHCVTAYELRRRGYDVEATPILDNQGRNLSDLLERFEIPAGADANPSYGLTNYFGNRIGFDVLNKSDLDKVVADNWPEGARGWVTMAFQDGGGHIFAVEKIDGRAVYLEPQAPRGVSGRDQIKGLRETAEGYFDRHDPTQPLKAVRVDDLIPRSTIIDSSDPLVSTRPDGIAARKKFAEEVADKLAKKAKIDQLKPEWNLVFDAADQANYERATFTIGVNDAVTKTAKQLAASEKKQLTKSQREAYKAGVEWYRKWLAAR